MHRRPGSGGADRDSDCGHHGSYPRRCRSRAGEDGRRSSQGRWSLIGIGAGARILIATKPVDFRKGAEGLASLAREALGQDPFAGTIIVFRSAVLSGSS